MKRGLNKTIENNLLKNNLWTDEIKKDCEDQRVFLAIRNNQVDLYHQGGRLFCFDSKGFKTHVKYASVISETGGKDYLTESELTNYKLASNFRINYNQIKENCSNYSRIEASGVSDLYHKHSYLSDSNVVVLDIEVSFESFSESNKQDRIDILLYNKDSQILKFVEAKHYSNKEIWSKATPKVISQIKRYESQIAERKTEILSEYSEYVRTLNTIFEIAISEPTDIEDKVTLLIFGFDDDQKKGRLKKKIIKNLVYSDTKIYSFGNIKQVVPENLWKMTA
ncbi:MAG: type I restriction enzyme HsdR N-terminal domain-containing protein [bacterium]|nr:type I restriction enzyme HsdR N-terminal domain-containing protein [bacterium]